MEKEPKSFGQRKNVPVKTFGRPRAEAAAPRDAAEIAASMPLSYVWFSFDKRINRKVYLLKGVLLLFLVQIAVQLVAMVIDFGLVAVLGPESIGRIIFAVIIGVPFIVLVIWASLAVSLKRCHDRDRSGWFLLISLIPLVGALWLLVELAFLKGTSGENRFGPDPLTAKV